jgi:hypothetical protein
MAGMAENSPKHVCRRCGAEAPEGRYCAPCGRRQWIDLLAFIALLSGSPAACVTILSRDHSGPSAFADLLIGPHIRVCIAIFVIGNLAAAYFLAGVFAKDCGRRVASATTIAATIFGIYLGLVCVYLAIAFVGCVRGLKGI